MSNAEQPVVLNLTQTQLCEICDFWLKELRLQPWKVEVSPTDPREIHESTADVLYDGEARSATLRISTDIENLEALHAAIVHELLHLFFVFIEPDSTEHLLEEQAVHSIAPAIARIYMKQRNPNHPW